MSRPRLTVTVPDGVVENATVTINGKPVILTGLEVVLRPQEVTTVFASFIPEHLEIDVDLQQLRLNGAQLPEAVGRALLAQLQDLYREVE